LKDETERTWALKKRKKTNSYESRKPEFYFPKSQHVKSYTWAQSRISIPNKLNVEEWNWKSSINLKKNQSKKK
jgi:hypothetical protein